MKRVTEDHDGRPVRGVASNYLCDLQKGDRVKVVGPYGATFLMPNHPGSSLLMICTGTGSAPMRAMTERRRRRIALERGRRADAVLRRAHPEELPYFGPLHEAAEGIHRHQPRVLARARTSRKQYVQDLIRARGDDVARLLDDADCYVYICGLKGMEAGVDDAFRDACRQHGRDWDALLPALRAAGPLPRRDVLNAAAHHRERACAAIIAGKSTRRP